MSKHENKIPIKEAEQALDAMSLQESVEKILTLEEIQRYSDLTENFLNNAGDDVAFETKLMALSLLKTLSHLSKSKDKLYAQHDQLPFEKNRALYYAVPFLAELAGKSNLLVWHQQQAKFVVNFKKEKGNYTPLRLMVLFYESAVFQAVMDKKNRKSYLSLVDLMFKKIREHLQDLQTAYNKKDPNHPWLSLDKASIVAYRREALLWKTIVDTTTVRHSGHLPPQFRRPPAKLPFEWGNLIKIKKANKVSMINAVYPLHGLASQCREIRTYSSFLLHRVTQERPNFFKSFENTLVDRHFLNRLRVAQRLKESYPNLPEGLPGKFQLEMFLVLIEQAINSLAAKHDLGSKKVEDMQQKFMEFNEQVQTKEEIVIEIPADDDFEEEEPPPPEEEKRPEIPTDYPAITNDQELGMGVTSMPYVFPFTYEEGQEEIPLEYLPSIRWDEFRWSAMNAAGVKLQVAETKLFVSKLEIVHAYRYEISPLEQIGSTSPYQNYLCFIGKQEWNGETKYYIVKKGGKKHSGKPKICIELNLSGDYIKNIHQGFFFIFPPPHNQHILAIPR